jgi:hypothetical protein
MVKQGKVHIPKHLQITIKSPGWQIKTTIQQFLWNVNRTLDSISRK